MNQKENISTKAKKLAYRDANKVAIESTAEGKSFLKSRYDYWVRKLTQKYGIDLNQEDKWVN